MTDSQENVGIVWMGGKSRRFHKIKGSQDSKFENNKIIAPLGGKPLFLWAFEAASSIVDRGVLSFHTSSQYNRFVSMWEQSSTPLPKCEVIIDSPRVPSRGPIQAQLTALREYSQAKKILTISADMPFLPVHSLKALVETMDPISTLQSTNKVMEPLVSCFSPQQCNFALEFLSLIPFGRGDDLHRAAESLSVITIPSDYPMEYLPWNLDINFMQDFIEINQIIKTRGINSIRKRLSLIQDIPIERRRVVNPSNHPQMLESIFTSPLDLYNLLNGNHQSVVYDKLIQQKSYFYAGRLAELKTQGNPIEPSTWYSKAAHCYWNEALFWLKMEVPFLAIHALFDCTHCLKAGSVDEPWEGEAKVLLSQLQEELNLTKGSR
jgi:molybdopterin-guanine dinucleotide biosynthesis protein A